MAVSPQIRYRKRKYRYLLQLIPFDSIEDIKVASQEYGEKRTVYKKLMRFDITVGGEDIWLLFDENYDSKRAADELIKLFGD